MSLRSDADKIIEESLHTVLPDQAVKRALKNYAAGEGRIALIAAGKAEWQLANAARSALGDACTGLVITKYGHVRGDIPGMAHHGKACCSIMTAVSTVDIHKASVHLQLFAWWRRVPLSPTSLRSNRFTFCWDKILVVPDILLDLHATALVSILLETIENDAGIRHSLAKLIVNMFRKAADDGFVLLTAAVSMDWDLEPVLLSIAELFAADAGSLTEFCQIHFIRRELVALFCLQLLQSLCYSVVEVIDFISAHNPPFGIDVMVNVKYRKESAKWNNNLISFTYD